MATSRLLALKFLKVASLIILAAVRVGVIDVGSSERESGVLALSKWCPYLQAFCCSLIFYITD